MRSQNKVVILWEYMKICCQVKKCINARVPYCEMPFFQCSDASKTDRSRTQGWQSHIIKHNSAWRILSSAAGDTMEIRKFIRTLENRGENTLKALESARELLKELEER